MSETILNKEDCLKLIMLTLLLLLLRAPQDPLDGICRLLLHALLVSLSTHFCHLLARLGAAEPRLDACCCIRLCQARLQP